MLKEMKRSASAGLAMVMGLTLICATAVAQEAAPAGEPATMEELRGDWFVMMVLGGAPQEAGLEVTDAENGEGLVVMFKTGQLGDIVIDDIEVDGDKHVLTYMMSMGDNEMDVQIEIDVDGDTFTGEAVVGGGMMTLPLEGARVGTEAATALHAKIEEIRAAADKPERRLTASEGVGFNEEWVLTIKGGPGGPEGQQVDLTFEEVDGFFVAYLDMPAPIGPQTITDLERDGETMILRFNLTFGDQVIDLEMRLERDGRELIGNVSGAGGAFSMEVTGLDRRTAEGLAEAGGSGAVRRSTARLELGENRIRVFYGKPAVDSAESAAMLESLTDGTIWSMGADQATKFKTDVDLKFGDKVLKAGWYGLWARRSGDGWILLINEKADVWSTMYQADSDLIEIPFEMSALEESARFLQIDLENEGDGAVLRFAWGNEEGRVRFSLADTAANEG